MSIGLQSHVRPASVPFLFHRELAGYLNRVCKADVVIESRLTVLIHSKAASVYVYSIIIIIIIIIITLLSVKYTQQ